MLESSCYRFCLLQLSDVLDIIAHEESDFWNQFKAQSIQIYTCTECGNATNKYSKWSFGTATNLIYPLKIDFKPRDPRVQTVKDVIEEKMNRNTQFDGECESCSKDVKMSMQFQLQGMNFSRILNYSFVH